MHFIENIKWKVSKMNRLNKMKFIRDYIDSLPESKIIDVGVQSYENESKDSFTNYIEKYFLSINRKIDVLGLDEDSDWSWFKKSYPNCNLILFDGRNFPTPINKYDFALSNAVLEHVGSREQQLEWLKGLRNICHNLIITTPNRFFPVEAHTNVVLKHIFSKKFKQQLIDNSINLFSYHEFLQILKQAGYEINTVKRNRILFMCIDFVAVCNSTPV